MDGWDEQYCILATTPWWLTMKRIEEWKEREPRVIDSIDQNQHLTKLLTKPSVVWLFWLFLIPNDMATVCPGGVTTTVTPQWPMWLAQAHCSDSSLSPLLPSPSHPSPPCLDPILARFCLRACSCHVTTLSSLYKLENFDGTTDSKNIHSFSLLLPSFFKF